jgi:hypothetical protein
MSKPWNPGKKQQVSSEKVLLPYTSFFPIFTVHATATEKYFWSAWDFKLIGYL